MRFGALKQTVKAFMAFVADKTKPRVLQRNTLDVFGHDACLQKHLQMQMRRLETVDSVDGQDVQRRMTTDEDGRFGACEDRTR